MKLWYIWCKKSQWTSVQIDKHLFHQIWVLSNIIHTLFIDFNAEFMGLFWLPVFWTFLQSLQSPVSSHNSGPNKLRSITIKHFICLHGMKGKHQNHWRTASCFLIWVLLDISCVPSRLLNSSGSNCRSWIGGWFWKLLWRFPVCSVQMPRFSLTAGFWNSIALGEVWWCWYPCCLCSCFFYWIAVNFFVPWNVSAVVELVLLVLLLIVVVHTCCCCCCCTLSCC